MSTVMRQKSVQAERMQLSEGEALGEVIRGEAGDPHWDIQDTGLDLNFSNRLVRTRMPGGAKYCQ